MPLNFGYIGIAKEATRGTAVAPTVFYRATAPAQVRAQMSLHYVPGIDDYGDVGAVPAARSGEGQFEVVVQPRSIGHLLTALLGAPTTTGTAPNYTHTWTPKTVVPTYTVEAQDGLGVHRLVGASVSGLELSHSSDGVLLATTDWVAMDRTTITTPATATYETGLYTVGQVVVSVGGTALAARARSVRVTLDFPKQPRQSLGQVQASEVDPTGEGSVEFAIELIADATDVSRLSAFLNASTLPVAVAWTIDANTSLSINANAVLTEDPAVVSNRDTGLATLSLSLRAIRTSGALVTVTAKNSQASY